MNIGGIEKVSLVDYPGKVSAVLFTQGCNFRCRYCHNPELVIPEFFGRLYDCEDIFEFLMKRKGCLEGVVLTGGEPTLQKGLIAFIRRIKSLNYAVKIDTNGSRPEIIKKLLKKQLIDFVAMDIKSPLEKYNIMACCDVDIKNISESLYIIENSGIEYEFRTTFDRSLLNESDIKKIFLMVKDPKRLRIQECIVNIDSKIEGVTV